MVSWILIGFGVFIFWMVCGAINVASQIAMGEHLTINEKRVMVGFGPFMTFFLILIVLFIFPAKWASIIGCRVGGYVRDKTR